MDRNLHAVCLIGPSLRPGKVTMDPQGAILVDSAEANDVPTTSKRRQENFARLQEQTQQLAANVLFLSESQAPWDGIVD